jgi:hypothetical protein
MEKVELGQTGERVSCMRWNMYFGSKTDEKVSFLLLDKYMEYEVLSWIRPINMPAGFLASGGESEE